MRTTHRTTRTRQDAETDATVGGSNVFSDLALPQAGERLAKAQLAEAICGLIRGAKLTQAQAARRLGVDQPKVSALMRGRLADFSTERLLRFLNALGQEVVLVIRPQSRPSAGTGLRVVVEAAGQ